MVEPAIPKKKLLLSYLQEFITPNKKNKFEELILHRTRHLTIVLEDIYQPHNASAVLRSCDCFGIQDVHIIENMNKYEVNPDVALGSSKWLNLIKYNEKENNTESCLKKLKSEGYRVIATTPHENDFIPETLPLGEKTALVFGTELAGLSQVAIDLADGFVRIPMYGFTESFNISVSAALLLFALTERMRKSDINWALTEAEKGTHFAIANDTLKWCVAVRHGKFDFTKYSITPLLKVEMATFVTLKIHGDLRGCIGSLAPVEPLYQSVHNNAVNAALRDPRFNPVEDRELPLIEVDVSVLSPIRDIPSIADFKIGQQGIILAKGRYRAVYLPEVATEQGWTMEETLASLSQKAGLRPDAWREGATFQVFESVVLSEK